MIKSPLWLRALRKVAFVIAFLDYTFKKVPRLFLKTKYVRVGSCNQCGKCCESIGFEMESWMLKIKFFRNLAIGWVSLVNNMEFKEVIEEDEMLLFKCNYLGKDGLCQAYQNRPMFCRIYPEVSNYFLKPVFLSECSYQSILRTQLPDFKKNPEKYIPASESDSVRSLSRSPSGVEVGEVAHSG